MIGVWWLGFGFRVWGFGVLALRFELWDLGFGMLGFGFRVQCLGPGVWGWGCRGWEFECLGVGSMVYRV